MIPDDVGQLTYHTATFIVEELSLDEVSKRIRKIKIWAKYLKNGGEVLSSVFYKLIAKHRRNSNICELEGKRGKSVLF